MRFNWYLVKISRKKSSHVIFLAIGDPGKQTHQRLFSMIIGEKEYISVLLLPNTPYTYFGDIPPLHHPIYLQLNRKEVPSVISVVEVPEEVVVVPVVDMVTEVVEAVVVAHPFAMEMVPLLVGLSLD